MRYLLLPFFLIRLFLTALPSLLLLLSIRLLPYRSSLASIFLLILVGLLLLTNLSSPNKTQADPKTELLEQKDQLESLLEKQPTHRDILFNLSKVNQALGNEQQALEYLNQAQNLDPNHQIFQGN